MRSGFAAQHPACDHRVRLRIAHDQFVEVRIRGAKVALTADTNQLADRMAVLHRAGAAGGAEWRAEPQLMLHVRTCEAAPADDRQYGKVAPCAAVEEYVRAVERGNVDARICGCLSGRAA